ncbi:MAG: hypothetical protein ABXS91_08490 [Sulfurimonas sp.]
MNAKEKNLNNLYRARVSHLKWVNTIKLLVSGFKVDKSHMTLPIIQDTEVGAWYYNQALQFAQFKSQNVLEEMERLLEAMFNYYAKIYAIYFTEKQNAIRSFFGKKEHSIGHNDQELASRYYEDIIKLSDEFKSKLHTLERQMMALQEKDHEMVSDFSLMNSESAPEKQVLKIEEEEEVDEVYSLRAR